ncbi:hypothetical protein RSOLAG22IIIB_13337 [Rhizoctonia solani]|uniref:Uncharacterized protein n=1 Tax=Rhizoctonia solani TaxID=456999 RepID=A0A0K6FM57_9AGAM|nr:hypothetical protein RSOLAG22IIIB_13337 [Rhizoctonia solani]
MLGLKALLILAAYICITVAAPPSSSGANVDPIPPDPDPPQDCPEGQWFWEAVSRCIPNTKKRRIIQDTSGIYLCPEYWIWNEELNHCAPRAPNVGEHRCPIGYLWKKYRFVCIRADSAQPNPQCGPGEWYWEAKSRCVPTINRHERFRSPDNYQCPGNWYWNNNFRHCVPRRAESELALFIRLLSSPINVHPTSGPGASALMYVCLLASLEKPPLLLTAISVLTDGIGIRFFSVALPPPLPLELLVLVNITKTVSALLVCLCESPTTENLDPPQSCPPGQWLWKVKAKHVCLLILAPETANPPPDGYTCPENWSWHHDLNHCVPSRPKDASKACTTGLLLDNTRFHCVVDPNPMSTLPPEWNICPENQWLWKTTGKCLPNGGTGKLPPARLGIVCPEFWYWHPDNHCAPPLPKNLGSYCPDGHKWDHGSSTCEVDPLQINAREA